MSDTSVRKYTAIWQSHKPKEINWVKETFGDWIGEHVFDSKHEVVLDNAILFDTFIYCFDPGYYAQFRGKNAFLVHFQDETYAGQYQLYENFRGVFRNYWSSIFNPRFVRIFPLGFTAGLPRPLPPIKRATEREYVWSFLGQTNKSSRPDMVTSLLRVQPHLFFSTDDVPGFAIFNQTGSGPRRYSPAEYAKIMQESIFAPSPMGNVHMECYRVYEALECGSIPMVEKRLTLDYFRRLLGDHPLPTVSEWPQAHSLIQRYLKNPEEMNRLQDRCMEWWRNYKLEYSQQISKFIDERTRADAEPVREPASAIHKVPGWQAVELMRHHDLNALSRRITRQATRLIRSGKMREAYRPGVRID
ncbi:MAG: hypothetical protein JOZ33_08400 [Acidobacteriaceae bacterium]|nr:hypothetical protein [Acidobacteriaceae bacterium]